MAYGPAPLSHQLAKPAPWNVAPAFVAPQWQWAWQGLIVAIPLWEGVGIRYLWDPALRDFYGQPPAPPWVLGRYGPALQGNASAFYQSTKTVPLTGSQPRTSIMLFQRTGPLDLGDGYWWSLGPDSVGNTWRMRGDLGRPRIEVNGGFATASTALTIGQWQVIAVRLPAGATNVTQTQFFLDGVSVSLASSGSQAINTTANVAFIGARSNAGTQPFRNANMGLVLHYDRALSDAEIRLLSNDPFGPFEANWDYAVASAFDPANLQVVAVGSDVTLTWDPSW